jgi:hypothetical protein
MAGCEAKDEGGMLNDELKNRLIPRTETPTPSAGQPEKLCL